MPIIWQIYVADEFAEPEEAGRFQSNEGDIGQSPSVPGLEYTWLDRSLISSWPREYFIPIAK